MENEGRFIGADNLAEVVRHIAAEKRSGTLVVTCSSSPTELYFYLGMLTGSGNAERPRRLGQILLSRGLIDRGSLDEALAYQQDFSPGTPLGKVLVFRERISHNALCDAIKLQLEEELWDLLMQNDGSYHFQANDVALIEANIVEVEPVQLVNTILDRRTEWLSIRAKISDDNMIPSVLGLQHCSDRESLHFGQKEWKILSLVNGYFDVSAVAARSGLGRFEAYRILKSFLSTDIITLHKPKEPAPADLSRDSSDSAQQRTAGHAKSSSSSSRWSGIMARAKDEQDTTASKPESRKLHFDSPVSFAVAITNKLIKTLMREDNFVVDANDNRLSERYWRQMLMNYPKADLVQANLNLLDASSFDRYIRTLGVQGPMKSIYLETMEALNRFLRTLYILSSQRLGANRATLIFTETMDGLKSRSSIKNGENFFFKEFAGKILE